MRKVCTLLVLITFFAAVSAFALPISLNPYIVNEGFEVSNTMTSCNWGSGVTVDCTPSSVLSWTGSSAGNVGSGGYGTFQPGTFNPSGLQFPAASGTNAAYTNHNGSYSAAVWTGAGTTNVVVSTNASFLYQDLAIVLQPNTSYEVSYKVARPKADANSSNYSAYYRLQINSGVYLWATVGDTSAMTEGTWNNVTLTFTTDGTVFSGNARLYLSNDGPVTDNGVSSVAWDETGCSGCPPVPEPGTLGTAAIFLLLLPFGRKLLVR